MLAGGGNALFISEEDLDPKKKEEEEEKASYFGFIPHTPPPFRTRRIPRRGEWPPRAWTHGCTQCVRRRTQREEGEGKGALYSSSSSSSRSTRTGTERELDGPEGKELYVRRVGGRILPKNEVCLCCMLKLLIAWIHLFWASGRGFVHCIWVLLCSFLFS